MIGVSLLQSTETTQKVGDRTPCSQEGVTLVSSPRRLGTGPFPSLSCPHQAGQLVEFLLCASLEAAVKAGNQTALAGQVAVWRGEK